MERRASWRPDRRAFVKLLVGVGATIVGARAFYRDGWLAGFFPGGEDLTRYEQAPPAAQPLAAPTVAIVRGLDPPAMVRQAVALAGGLGQVIAPGSAVLIKPNLTIPSRSGLGNVTDSRVVQAVIELCRAAGAARIMVGDGSGGGDSVQIMRQAGYEPVLRATGATFVDLNGDPVVNLRLADPDALSEYSIAQTAAETPVLISLPVLKTHRIADVSLSCKNLMGITARSVYGRPRQKLHDSDVRRVTADLVRLRTPSFAVVDGIVGLEGDSPLNGTPVPMNLVIAGRNPVSVDAVAAAVMGFDPRQLMFLALLAMRGVGEIELGKIAVVGASVADVRRSFKTK